MTGPLCARCGRPVEKFTETHDPWLGRVVFVVECHGAREKITVPTEDLASVTLGVAFQQPLALEAVP